MCNIIGDQNVDQETGERTAIPVPDSEKSIIYTPTPSSLIQDLGTRGHVKVAVKGGLIE